ncbi:MAG: hypothetical protein H0V17_09120 [Deltaproteobacteria bacterium]|nr:hypothetical protein [Deltaproteobacteria bacterium]
MVLAACGSDGVDGIDVDDAPVASVDRFSDSFGKLFKRSGPAFDPVNVQAVVPAPNAPIDFDELFTVSAFGPTGDRITYYSLDILPREPAKGYRILRNGQPVPGQLEIHSGLPGDAGYNDFVQITEVSVGDGYVANSLQSASEVEAAIAAGDVTASQTTTIANWAIVPAGSTADRAFRGNVVTGNRAWVDGEVAHFLRFEENLEITDAGTVPVAEIIVIFDNNMNPSEGFATEADGHTHNAIDTVATDPGYSSLWNHSVGNKANFAAVTDFQTAFDNVMAADVGVDVNCPEVE